RVVLSNVSFDDLTLADWEAKSVGKVECPFTFTDYEFLDEINV
ncbi:phage tail tube protein, partial [Intestinimonas butyriciproducens]